MAVFRGFKDYLGLEEAVNAIMAEDTDAEYDVVIIPPDPGVVTDEEEGEDDLQTSDLPRDVPGTLEVTHRRRHDSSEWEDSDDEPLSSKRSRQDSRDLDPKWRKCTPSYSTSSQLCDNMCSSRKTQVINQLKDLSPTEVFEKIFDEEVYNLIIYNSLLYAGQNNRHGFEMNKNDLRRFLGILILSGYHKLPRERQYWSYDEDIGVPLVSNCMSRNRFLEIKRNLHLVDNSSASDSRDKMFKVRPLCDMLIQKYCQYDVFHEDISIDESMIKYYGHHPTKQYIRGKPIRFGYKNWVAASSDGYCYSFDLYCGKTTENTKEPLGTRVVKLLLSKIPAIPEEHTVYFDNFFTSCDLLIALKKTGYKATGTIRENRTKKCPLRPVNSMKKSARAEYDHRFDTKNELLLVRWKDNSVCTIGTNFDTVEPIGKVKRWCSQSRQKVDVNIPHLFQNYNRGMGGVDELDGSISLYRVSIRGKKWWWCIFTYLLDMSIANAWRLHNLTGGERFDQLTFRRHIARNYLQLRSTNKSRPSGTAIAGLNPSNNGHNPGKLPKQLRCVLCHTRIKWQCVRCLKTLCIDKNCFANYHS